MKMNIVMACGHSQNWEIPNEQKDWTSKQIDQRIEEIKSRRCYMCVHNDKVKKEGGSG